MGRVLLLIVGFVVALGLAGASQPGQGAGREQAAAEKSVATPTPSPFQQPDEPDDASRPCGEHRYDSNDDLCAQWKAADAAAEAASYAAPLYWLSVLGAVIGFLTAVFAGGAAWFAKRAADAARAQLAHTEYSTERQLRAYVGATGLHMTGVAPGSSPVFHYTLKNTGQTPARGIRIRLAFRAAASRDVPIHFPFGMPPQKFDLGAGSETEQSARWHDGANVMPTLTDNDFKAFVNGDWTFTFAGYVQYRDVFGKTRRTIFRGYAPNHGMTDGKLSMMVARKHVRAT